MATCGLTKVMRIGNVVVFSKQHQLQVMEHDIYKGWERVNRHSIQVAHTHPEAVKEYGEVHEAVDIHTPFTQLLAQNVVVNVGFGEIQQPSGRSCGWLVEIDDIQVLDRADGANTLKTIRVRYRLHTNGNVQTRIDRLHFFGIALDGTIIRSMLLPASEAQAPPGSVFQPFSESLLAGRTLVFSKQERPVGGNFFEVPASFYSMDESG